MEKINFYVGRLQIDKLRFLAKSTGLSVAEHIRRAIDAYLKKLGK